MPREWAQGWIASFPKLPLQSERRNLGSGWGQAPRPRAGQAGLLPVSQAFGGSRKPFPELPSQPQKNSEDPRGKTQSFMFFCAVKQPGRNSHYVLEEEQAVLFLTLK